MGVQQNPTRSAGTGTCRIRYGIKKPRKKQGHAGSFLASLRTDYRCSMHSTAARVSLFARQHTASRCHPSHPSQKFPDILRQAAPADLASSYLDMHLCSLGSTSGRCSCMGLWHHCRNFHTHARSLDRASGRFHALNAAVSTQLLCMSFQARQPYQWIPNTASPT